LALPCCGLPQLSACSTLLAEIKDKKMQTAEPQGLPKASQRPQIHLAVNELQGGKGAGGVPLGFQKHRLRRQGRKKAYVTLTNLLLPFPVMVPSHKDNYLHLFASKIIFKCHQGKVT
jgi:hypothetical protein